MAEYRVLIVDDSRFMRQVISDVVSKDNAFTVAATASDGEEAVKLALELQPDLIIMDLEMPRMNGLEALQKIMAARPAPVIMMSAVTDNGTRDTIKALQYGAFDFIRKPDKSLQLDIGEVSEYLLEKLHAAAAALGEGAFQVMPAIEDSPQASADKPAESAAIEEAAEIEQHRAPPDRLEVRHEPQQTEETPKKQEIEKRLDERIYSSTQPASSVPRQKQVRKTELKQVRKTELKQVRKTAAKAGQTLKPRLLSDQVQAKPAPSWKPKPEKERETNQPAAAGKSGIRGTVIKGQPSGDSGNNHSSEFQHIVAIGTSTGGPRALHEVLAQLPKDFEAPILVVQHMPPKFTQSLAQRLDSLCALKVREAAQGDLVETGTVYIAPGGWHMRLTQDHSGKYRIKLTNEGPRNGHMPSVDVLFESLVGRRELKRHAVLMTGMGSDGAAGMLKLQQDGSETRIAQSQETCVVYGMPGSAVKLGAVSQVIPLQQIASALVREVRNRSK